MMYCKIIASKQLHDLIFFREVIDVKGASYQISSVNPQDLPIFLNKLCLKKNSIFQNDFINAAGTYYQSNEGAILSINNSAHSLVGAVSLARHTRTVFELCNVEIFKQYRRKGLATHLVVAALELLSAANKARAFTVRFCTSVAGEKLFEHIAFDFLQRGLDGSSNWNYFHFKEISTIIQKYEYRNHFPPYKAL